MLAAEEINLRHAPCSSRMATPCSEDISLLSSSNCPRAFGHASRDLDMVVHGDGFVVAGCGDGLNWLSQKLNEMLELVLCDVQRPRADVVWQWQSLDSWWRVHRRAQAARSRVHNLTTRN